MGIFSWFWGLFSGFFESSRYKEEKGELGKEKKALMLTKKQMSMEKGEEEIIKDIINGLKHIHSDLPLIGMSNTQIQVGNQIVNANQSIFVLITNLKRLVKTNTSIQQEESIVSNMRNYWAIVRRCLLGAGVDGQVARIDSLFRQLGVELRMEEEITADKLRLVQDEARIAMQEAGGMRRAA